MVIEYPAQTDPHERIQQLIQEYREDPGSSIILRELGRTYREISQLDTAQFYLEQALAVNRQDWEALAILGSIHADKEDYETALSYYSRAFELGEVLELLSLVGEALYLLGRYEEAESHLRVTIGLEGSHKLGFSHFLLGKVLCALNHFEEAFEEFKVAEQFKKTDEGAEWLKFAKMRMHDT